MNSELIDLEQSSEIIIPDEIIRLNILCFKCSKSHRVKVIKNQILVSFDCTWCKTTIVYYTWNENADNS